MRKHATPPRCWRESFDEALCRGSAEIVEAANRDALEKMAGEVMFPAHVACHVFPRLGVVVNGLVTVMRTMC